MRISHRCKDYTVSYISLKTNKKIVKNEKRCEASRPLGNFNDQEMKVFYFTESFYLSTIDFTCNVSNSTINLFDHSAWAFFYKST